MTTDQLVTELQTINSHVQAVTDRIQCDDVPPEALAELETLKAKIAVLAGLVV